MKCIAKFAFIISFLLVSSAALARVALGLWSKPPSYRRLLFQSVVKSTEAVKPTSFQLVVV